MADSLAQLENQRAALLAQFYDLGDFRPGSITTTSGNAASLPATAPNPRVPCMAQTFA